MSRPCYSVGQLVVHPNRPEWGRGKVLAVAGDVIVVFFRDIPEVRNGDAIKRINFRHAPLSEAPAQTDPWLDHLPPLVGDRLPFAEPRITLSQAIDRFRSYFDTFQDRRYLERERDYKWRAHGRFLELLGDGQGHALLSQGAVDEVVRRLLAVERSVNLLSLHEKAAFTDGLKDRAAAEQYASSLFDLLASPSRNEGAFDRLVRAVNNLPAEEGRARVATWPILTIMPFLAQPDRYMFLKPEVTKIAADRLRWNLNYNPSLNWLTYSRLLGMSDQLMESLRPLGARDFIDVQSFIWVTGHYEPPKA